VDTPPTILAYATPTTVVQADDSQIILPQPPPGYEIALLVCGLLVCFGAILIGLLMAITYALSQYNDGAKGIGALVFVVIVAAVAMRLMNDINRRREFGGLPITLRRLPDGRIQIHYPARWRNKPLTYQRGALGRVAIARRGWASNLLPLYQLRIRWAHLPYTTTVKLPFVLPDPNEVPLLKEQIVALIDPARV